MLLMLGLYRAPNEDRYKEILYCLDKNLANPAFTKKHIFLEEGYALDERASAIIKRYEHTVCFYVDKRMTFRKYFEHANAESEELAVLTNSDVYFDETLNGLAARFHPNYFMAVGRWHVQADGSTILDKKISVAQDVWIFKTPVRIPSYCDFSLGWKGCDSRIAREMKCKGYRLINPPWDIHVYHLHLSDIRNDVPTVARPHMHINPERLP